MTNEKAIGASSLPAIDRGTSARTKMSRKRFLAFSLVGIMVVAAVSMVAPAMLGNNGQDDDGQSVQVSWVPAGKREAVYKIDHMFEMYLKNQNYLKSSFNRLTVAASELGHTTNTMGVNEWLNTSAGASYRQTGYGEYTLRNKYPYLFATNPIPGATTAQFAPGIQVWAPFTIHATVKNDTLLKTGYANAQRNVPFVPTWDGALAGRGGWVNLSLYGTYLTSAEMDDINAGTHYANWFYGVPAGYFVDSASNDGYWYELHGTYYFSRDALMKFLDWNGVGDARTWFNANVGDNSILKPTGIMSWWQDFVLENYSQNAAEQNGNIYTVYEYDMVGGGGLYNWLKLDTPNSTANGLTIRGWMAGWGPDGMIMRMIEAANITGSIGTMTNGNPMQGWNGWTGKWSNRAPMLGYHEDLYLNCSISQAMANSSMRQVTTYMMTAYEDDSDNTWSGGWKLEIGAHMDYLGTVTGGQSQNSYPSPYDKYDPDKYAPDYSIEANLPGTTLFNRNVSYFAWAPHVRNLTKYECIIVSLTTGTAKTNAQVLGIQPYTGLSNTLSAAKVNELNRWSYWGNLRLGDGSYPRTEIIAGYTAATRTLNLSGGTTGMPMPQTLNTDYWGSYASGRHYIHSLPTIQMDVAYVDHYDVVISGSGDRLVGIPYTVTVTARNATNAIATKTNTTVLLTTNNPGSTFGAASHLFVNGTDVGVWSTTITFGTAKDNSYVNATDSNFDFVVGEYTFGSVMVPVIIPEFATLLIPIVGAMAVFFVMSAKKRRKTE